jgi:hypothetical protein
MSLREALTGVGMDGSATIPTPKAIAKHIADNYLAKSVGQNAEENPHLVRRRRMAERIRYYRDDYEDDARALIDLIFEDLKVKEQRKRLVKMALGMNVTKRVINEISSVYDRPAKRFYRDDELGTSRLRDVESDYSLHLTFKEAHRLANLCNEVLLWHVESPANNERRLDILTPDMFDVISDPRDPKVPAGYLIDTDPGFPVTGALRRSLPHWQVWDDETVYYLNADGMLIRTEANPIGKVPGVLVHRAGRVQSQILDPSSGQDLVSAHQAVLFLNLLALRLAKSQGERQPVLRGLLAAVAKGQSMDGETPIALPPEVDLQMLDSKTDPEHYLKLIKHWIGGVAQTYGMSYEQFTFQETSDTTSGRAYQVRREKLTEIRNEQAAVWHKVEPATLELLGLPTDGLVSDFREQGLPQDPKSEVDLLTERMRKGLETPIDYLMRHDPDLTEETALIKLRKTLVLNSMIWEMQRRLNMPANADAQDPGQSPEQNGAGDIEGEDENDA